jgi:hypothetical protein
MPSCTPRIPFCTLRDTLSHVQGMTLHALDTLSHVQGVTLHALDTLSHVQAATTHALRMPLRTLGRRLSIPG